MAVNPNPTDYYPPLSGGSTGGTISGAVSVTNLPATQPVSLAALPALPAGAAQIGLVTAGGFTTQIQVVPATTAVAYATGSVLGGILTFANAARIAAGSGIVQAATATFVSGVIPNLDLILFNALPSGGTITNATLLVMAAANLAKIIGVIHMSDATLLGAAAPSLVQGETQAIPFKLAAGTSLYAVLVTRTAITLASATDATVTLSVLQD